MYDILLMVLWCFHLSADIAECEIDRSVSTSDDLRPVELLNSYLDLMGRPTVQFSDTAVPVRSSGYCCHGDGGELLPVCDQLDEDMMDIEEETEDDDEDDEEDDDDMCEEIARQAEIISARDYQVVPCVSSVLLLRVAIFGNIQHDMLFVFPFQYDIQEDLFCGVFTIYTYGLLTFMSENGGRLKSTQKHYNHQCNIDQYKLIFSSVSI